MTRQLRRLKERKVKKDNERILYKMKSFPNRNMGRRGKIDLNSSNRKKTRGSVNQSVKNKLGKVIKVIRHARPGQK